MLILLLMGELVLHVFEDGWPEVIVTVAALFCALYAMGRNKKAWDKTKFAVDLARRNGHKLGVVASRSTSGGVWILDRTFLEAVAFLHIVVVPPWFFFLRTGNLFFGFHLIAFACAVLAYINDRLGRGTGAPVGESGTPTE